MQAGQPAPEVVASLTGADRGREWRQMAALDTAGRTGAFTGGENSPAMGHHAFARGIASGNMLASEPVVERLADGYLSAHGTMAERLLAALRAAEAAGSDFARASVRGAARAVPRRRAPDPAHPTTTRAIPSAPSRRCTALPPRANYAAWAAQVPHPADKERGLD